MSLLLESNIKSENDAINLVANTIKNPPTNPVQFLQFAQDNFKITGTITKGLESFLPMAAAVLPIASAIFSAFSSFSAPSIGEQILSGLSSLSEQISAEIEDLKNYLDEISNAATLKTIDLTLDGVTNLALEESAVRVVIGINQSEITAKFQAERNKIFAEYQDKVNALRESFFTDAQDYIDKARRDSQELYDYAQGFLADKVLELLKSIQRQFDVLAAAQISDDGARAVQISPPPTPPQISANSERDGVPLGLLAIGGAALVLLLVKRKKN